MVSTVTINAQLISEFVLNISCQLPRILRPCCMQQCGPHRCDSLSIGSATLKHFNQMTEPKIIYLLHIIYTAHDSWGGHEGRGRVGRTPVLALLNLFALWRRHEPKTETENRNEKQPSLCCWSFGSSSCRCSCCCRYSWGTNRF